MSLLVEGRDELRVRFGCAPLEFQNLKTGNWTKTNFTVLLNVEVFSCAEHLCNSVDLVLDPEEENQRHLLQPAIRNAAPVNDLIRMPIDWSSFALLCFFFSKSLN